MDLKTHLVVTKALSTQSFVNSLVAVLMGGTKHAFLGVKHPKCVEEIERELYVDDILSGGPTTE